MMQTQKTTSELELTRQQYVHVAVKIHERDIVPTWKDGAAASSRAAATDTGTATSRVTGSAPHPRVPTRCERPIAQVRTASVAASGVTSRTTALCVTPRSEGSLARISGMTVSTIDNL